MASLIIRIGAYRLAAVGLVGCALALGARRELPCRPRQPATPSASCAKQALVGDRRSDSTWITFLRFPFASDYLDASVFSTSTQPRCMPESFLPKMVNPILPGTI